MDTAFDTIPADLPSPLAHDSVSGVEHADDREAHRGDLENRRAAIIRSVRDYAHATFDELHAASRRQTEELLQGAMHIKLDEEEIRGWEDFCEQELAAMQKTAHTLYHEKFMDRLLDAYNQDVISLRVVKELDEKFRDENANYKARESYILSILPQRIETWREVKEQRDRLLKHENFSKLSRKQVKDIDIFLNGKKFVDLKYPARKGLADAVEAALRAMENDMEERHESAQKELERFVKQGYMHPSKVGPWMKRIFDCTTSDEVDGFVKKIVRPNARRWQEACKRFDELEQEMDTHGTPRGMQRIKRDAFLLKSYTQKTAYLSLLELRLNDVPEHNRTIAALKLSIRHNLDTEDWEGAEEELREALQIKPTDRELRSMHTFLRTHRPTEGKKQKENPDPQKILDDMRSSIHAMPADLQWLYSRAAMDGRMTFERMLQISYNRVWVTEHNYANQAQDRLNAESDHNKSMTKHYMEEGHSRLFERNIVDGDTAAESAIRDHCTKPQMLYTGSMGREALLQKVHRNALNWGFGYWTTLIPTNVDYAIHRGIVKEHHYKLKSGMRMLDKMGYRYTTSGVPEPKATAASRSPKAPTFSDTHLALAP